MCLVTEFMWNGQLVRAWTCKNLDPDDPERLARLYPQEEYEDPREVELMFRTLVCRDPQPRAKHLRLVDLADDGTVYTER